MDRSLIRLRSFCASSLLLALGVSGAALAQSSNQGSERMHKVMSAGMQHMQSMKMTGDTDKDFAMMMRMHHQQALDMAKAEVEHGKSPDLKAMAQKIIKDQTQEIAKLDAWLQKTK